MSQKELFHLSDLFYYDPSQKKYAHLQKGLKEYQCLLKAGLFAIQDLLDGHLEKFDSLVGENACQIRAIKMALIASKDLRNFECLKERLISALATIDPLLTVKMMDGLMRKGTSLKDLLDEYNLDISLTSEERFVIMSFILSEMKICLSDGEIVSSIFQIEKSSPSKLQLLFPEISYTFIHRVGSKIRRLISETSVAFVRKIASDLENQHILNILDTCSTVHNTWPCTPMFWTYKTLLTFAQNKNIPIILHVKFLTPLNTGFRVTDEDFICFKPCPETQVYREVAPSYDDLERPACIIQGIACGEKGKSLPSKKAWRKTISKHSLIDVILAGAAHHRQYPNPEESINISCLEYETYKQLAESHGFSSNNPTTFFIQHVYSAQIGRKMSVSSNLPKQLNFKRPEFRLSYHQERCRRFNLSEKQLTFSPI